MGKHRYGMDLELDLFELYGEDYKVINTKRRDLWDKLTKKGVHLCIKSIIQNPVLITKTQYDEWVEILNKNKDDFSKNQIYILEEVKEFVVKYHLLKNKE